MTLALCLAPSLAWGNERPAAGTPPEALLSSQSLAYLRIDGVAKHRGAYEQSALAEIIHGDWGRFIKACSRAVREYVHKDGAAAEDDKVLKLFAALDQAKGYFFEEGAVFGFELISVKEQPRWQVTCVLPNGAREAHWQRIQEVLEAWAVVSATKIEEEEIAGRTVYFFTCCDSCRLCWWCEGTHAVLLLGTEKAEATLQRLSRHARRDNLAGHPLYRRLQGTPAKSGYTPIICGFVDAPRTLELLNQHEDKQVGEVVKALGLAGLQGVSFSCGFEGKAWRTTCAIHAAGPRQGMLKLLTAPSSVDLAKLPALAADATEVCAFSFDFTAAFDVVQETACNVVKALEPDALAAVAEAFKQVNVFAGCDVRKDLLGSLGNTVVYGNSPTDGFWFLGSTLAMEVKNPEKLLECLENLFPALSQFSGVKMKLHKSHYRGVDVYTVRFDAKELGWDFVPVPSFTIHNGWLVVSSFPQGVQGYILRCQGKAPAWKPSAELVQAFGAARRTNGKVVGFSQSDPRPMVKFLASFTPIVSGLLEANAAEWFDPYVVPNPSTLAQSLFPEVSLAVDDGSSVCWESYQATPIPLNPVGLLLGYQTMSLGIACGCGVCEAELALPAPRFLPVDPSYGNPEGNAGDRVEPDRLSPPRPPAFTESSRPPQLMQSQIGQVAGPPSTSGTSGTRPCEGGFTSPCFMLPVAAPLPIPVPVDFMPVTRYVPQTIYMPVPGPNPRSSTGMPMVNPVTSPTSIQSTPAVVAPAVYAAPVATPAPSQAAHPFIPLPHHPVQEPVLPHYPIVPPLRPPTHYPPTPPVCPPPPAANVTPAPPTPAAVKTTVHVYPVGDLLGPMQDVQALLRILKMVEPSSWDCNNGCGTIEYFERGEAVVVRQTDEVHQRLDQLLQDLRDAAGKVKIKKPKMPPQPIYRF